jgi:AcrR family transcriptional regulator
LAAASVEDIAERAGYTRGAFYSNFDSKTDLFIELLKRDHDDISHQLQHLLDAGLSIEDTQRQLALFYGQCYRDDNNFALWAEARLHALRDAKFRVRFNALCLEKRDVIAYFITQFCKMMDIAPPAPPADLAFGTMSLIDGMRFFNACMPNDLPDERAQAVLSAIFAATFFR